jgi:hypothetical protein
MRPLMSTGDVGRGYHGNVEHRASGLRAMVFWTAGVGAAVSYPMGPMLIETPGRDKRADNKATWHICWPGWAIDKYRRTGREGEKRERKRKRNRGEFYTEPTAGLGADRRSSAVARSGNMLYLYMIMRGLSQHSSCNALLAHVVRYALHWPVQ